MSIHKFTFRVQYHATFIIYNPEHRLNCTRITHRSYHKTHSTRKRLHLKMNTNPFWPRLMLFTTSLTPLFKHFLPAAVDSEQNNKPQTKLKSYKTSSQVRTENDTSNTKYKLVSNWYLFE